MEIPPDSVGLIEGLTTTRAIRRLRPDRIPEGDLATILFCATRAPSGSNRQPFRFLVLRDGPKAREAKALIKQSAARLWGGKREAEGYDTETAERPRSPQARIDAAMRHLINHFEEVPVVVLPCFVRYRAPNPFEGGSIYPACQNLLLAARALGYGGLITGYHVAVEKELRALLEIPDGVFVAATIPLGRPHGRHGPVRRRPTAELVYEEGWDRSAGWAEDPPGTRFTVGPTGSPKPDSRFQ